MATYSPQFDASTTTLCFLKPVNGVSELYAVDLPAAGAGAGADGPIVPRRVLGPESGGDTEATLTLEEKLRRERSRQLTTGITSFGWIPGTTSVVVPQQGRLLVVEAGASSSSPSPTPTVLYDRKADGSPGAAIDPQPSPDGRRVAFVADNELYVVSVPSPSSPPPSSPAAPVRLTHGARESGTTNGLADYLAAEELDRQTGFWWSPCGRYIAFQHTDDLHVPLFRIAHPGSDAPDEDETHRYPFAGKRNPVVRLGVLAVEDALAGKATPVWMDLGPDEDIYLARVAWGGGGSATSSPLLTAQVLNRTQSVIDLVAFDARTGKGSLLVREQATPEAWINVVDLFAFVEDEEKGGEGAAAAGAAIVSPSSSSYFLWGSERTGFMHLYLYTLPPAAALAAAERYAGPPKAATGPPLPAYPGADGGASVATSGLASLHRPVTAGSWIVEGIVHVEKRKRNGAAAAALLSASPSASRNPSALLSSSSSGPAVFFTGSLDGPLERHLYSAPVFVPEARQRSGSVGGNPDLAEAVAVESIYGIPGCRRLTSGAGMHTAVLARNGHVFADTLSSLHGPPSLAVYRIGDPDVRFPASPGLRAAAASSFSPSSTLAAAAAGGGAGGAAAAGTPFKASRSSTNPLSPPLSASGAPRTPANASSSIHGTPRGRTSSSSVLSPAEAAAGFSDDYPWPLNGAAVSFDRTGAYGPRMSVGVTLLSVAHNALPTSGGTPPCYAALKAQLHVTLGLLTPEEARGAADDGDGGADIVDLRALKTITAPVSAAVNTLAAAVSSRIETFRADMGVGNGGASSSLNTFGAKLMTLGAQAGAMLAGMGLSEEEEEGEGEGEGEGKVAAASSSAATLAPLEVVGNDAEGSPTEATPVPGAGQGASAPPAPAAAAPGAAASAATPTPTPSPSPPLLVRLLAADGSTPLYAALFLPDPAVHGYGPYPTVMAVYGGPHVQRVKHCWTTANELRAQALRKDGVLVVMVDNRGAARRGVAFEAHIKHKMGTVEVEDQVAAVRSLVACGLADAARVGVYGWSYGGYMTLLCLSKAPDVFAAGVAGAPVTSWDGYDTAYTERYMGTPESNPAGYAEGSVMTHAGGLVGKVLLVHGLLDENVHVRHTYRLLNAFVGKNVPYDFIALPNERHVPRGQAERAFMEARVRDYLKKWLKVKGV
jgi:dienelactone hydrolase